jgi:hypothetical protein
MESIGILFTNLIFGRSRLLYSVDHIKEDIIEHVNEKKPFSIVRVGDGDLKLLASLIEGKVNRVKFDRIGLPDDKGNHILNIYKNACSNANYTSSFEMYYTPKFWSRDFSPGTKKKVLNWKAIYRKAGIKNDNYCNPEVGFLLFLSDVNLLASLKDKRICLITCYRNLERKFRKAKYNSGIIQIPKLYSGHYRKYGKIVKRIKASVDDFDVFFIGAGVLGRGYCDVIKNSGGVAVDIGQVMNTWSYGKLPKRFKGKLTKSGNFLYDLNGKTKKFREYI